MRFARRAGSLSESKCEIEMTPTLDIIFQLLIFFILTFKPITEEGQFGVNLAHLPVGGAAVPTVVPGEDDQSDASLDVELNPPFRIRLAADADGNLAKGGVFFGEERRLPSLDYLRFELRNTAQGFTEDFEVVIEADPGLRWEYLVQAVNAISHAGIRKINFAAPASGG
jgi:biopolymer transport protein ExbD